MIKNFLVFLALVFSAVQMTSQTDSIPAGKYGVDYCITDASGMKQGYWLRVYESGALYYTGQFKNNMPVDTFTYFYETGEVMTIAIHDGKKASTNSYRTDGSVISKGDYINQKKSGTWRMYDENGILTSEENYAEDKLDGLVTVYYKNGNKAKTMNYKEGELHGSWKEYFPDGSLKGKGTYIYGKQDGELTAYQAPNVLLYEGQLKDERAVGEWRHYLEDGQLKLRILYDDSGVELRRKNENGEFEEFYDSGIPKSYYEYKHGKKHGPFEEYYNQGDFVRREVISSEPGQPIEFKETLENTQLKMEGEYRNDKLVGEVIYYNEDGTILKKETYDQGVLVE